MELSQKRNFQFKIGYRIIIFFTILFILLSQGYIQYFIYTQKFESNRINISGRQRMLSQFLTKELLKVFLIEENRAENFALINTKFTLWKNSHVNLLNGNRELNILPNENLEAKKLFEELTPCYQRIVETIETILRENKISETQLKIILENEKVFLKLMDSIVNEYNKENVEKISWLQFIQIFLTGIILLIIILEIIFLYKPIFLKMENDLLNLQKQKEDLEDFSQYLSHTFRENILKLSNLVTTIKVENKLAAEETIENFQIILKHLDSKIISLNEKANQHIKIFENSFPELIGFEKDIIILIDDDRLTSLLNKKIILMAFPKVEVIMFTDASQGLEYLMNQKNVKTVLPKIYLDLNMPTMNGWQFLEEIEKKNILVNIFILSSSIDYKDMNKSKKYNSVKGFLTKPLTTETLLNSNIGEDRIDE